MAVHGRPYLDFPSRRVAPPALVKSLRMIDRSAELVWLRRGCWALGTVKHDNRARGKAEKQMYELLESAGTLNRSKVSIAVRRAAREQVLHKLGLLNLRRQGWLHQQTFPDLYDSELGVIERWFREAVWVRQHCYEQTFNQIEADLDRNPEAEAKLADLTDRARLNEAYRIGFKRPVSVLSAGIPQLRTA